MDIVLLPPHEADRAYRLRHDVYVREEAWEPPTADGLERDPFDGRSIHVVVADQGEDIAAARLVEPSWLPMREVCPDRLRGLPPATTGEISRFCVIAERRNSADVRMALVEGLTEAAVNLRLEFVVALLRRALLLGLRRDGVAWFELGAPVEHHGERQPAMTRVDAVACMLVARKFARLVNAA